MKHNSMNTKRRWSDTHDTWITNIVIVFFYIEIVKYYEGSVIVNKKKEVHWKENLIFQ